MCTVYVLQNKERGKIYIGYTTDLQKRLARHNGILNNKSTSFTNKQKGRWEIVYKEELPTREDAIKREKQLKSYRGREYIKNILSRYVQAMGR